MCTSGTDGHGRSRYTPTAFPRSPAPSCSTVTVGPLHLMLLYAPTKCDGLEVRLLELCSSRSLRVPSQPRRLSRACSRLRRFTSPSLARLDGGGGGGGMHLELHSAAHLTPFLPPPAGAATRNKVALEALLLEAL
jgi:hypothetical protein